MKHNFILIFAFLSMTCSQQESTSTTETPIKPETKTIIEVKKPKEEAPGLAKKILEFGGTGTTAGLFDNARAIGVAPDGSNIYIADYNKGRIQKFDSAGKFISQLNIEPNKITTSNIIYGLSVDFLGNLYISRSGNIIKYKVSDDSLVSTIKGDYPDTMYSIGIAVDSKNHVYTFTDRFGEINLIIFDEKGKKLERRKKIEATDIAVDGLGTVYLFNSDECQIEIYNEKGELKSKFGNCGNDKDQINRSSDGFAITGKGHILIGNSNGIQIFDNGGRFIDLIDVKSVKDFSLDTKGDLYVLGNDDMVRKYELNLPVVK